MKTKAFYVITALLLIILLTPAVSCSQGGVQEPAAQEISAANVADRVQEASKNLKTYHLDMEMTMGMKGVVNGESGDINMSAKSDGAVDLVVKKMGMEMAMSMKGKGGDTTIDEVMKLSTYIIDNMMYTGTTDAQGKTQWQRKQAPSSTWQNQVDQQIKLLKSSKILYLKSEKVQGVPCYVVELDPDLDTLWGIMMQQSALSQTGMDIPNMKDAVKKVTYKYWLNKDTLFMTKGYGYVEMELTAAQLGQGNTGQLKMVVELTIDFNKLNESVDITLPAGAKGS